MRGRDLVHPFHGVVVAQSVPLDLLTRCAALQKRMPADAFFCSSTAAAIMRLPIPLAVEGSLLVKVAVPAPRRALSARGVVGHKVQLMGGDVQVWGGLRISSPQRAWCELGAILPILDLVAAGDYLIHWRSPVVTADVLADAVSLYPGRRGKPALTEALGLLDDRAESAQESKLRVILLRAGLDGFAVNHEIRLAGRTYRADLAYPGPKVIIEYQGDHHRDQAQWRADITRISRLEADGWFVIQVNADDLAAPMELTERVRRVLATRGDAPRGKPG